MRYIIICLFLLNACATKSEDKITRSEIIKEIAKLEKKINDKLPTRHGDLIIKYDLLQLNSNQKIDHCPTSVLYNELTLHPHETREKFYSAVKKYNEKIDNKKFDDLAIDYLKNNIEKKIAKLTSIIPDRIAKKISLPKLTKKNTKKLKQPSINLALEQLAVINKITTSLPIIHPLPHSKLTSDFKLRKDPFTKKITRHKGIDLQDKKGSLIYSAAQGVVSSSGKNGNYGNLIIIDHGQGYSTRYAHLSKIYVSAHEHVNSKQPIGIQGGTGKSTSEHLHYEVRYNGAPIDPKTYLKLGKGC